MTQVLWTPQARADLDEIALYIATEGSLEASDRFIDELTDTLSLYASQPESGRARPELTEDLESNLRSFPFGNYVVFYRPITDGIDLVRILHGSRDIPSLF